MALSRGQPRSARYLVGHPGGRAYRVRRTVPGLAVAGRYPWPPVDQTRQRSPEPVVGVAVVPKPLSDGARRAVRRRAWAWRLMLTGWAGLTGITVLVGLRWFGAASLCCPAGMAVVLPMLGWCAAADLRAYRRELRDRR